MTHPPPTRKNAMRAGVTPHIEPCLSVVMPAYNEEATIVAVAKRVLESPYTQELIIVDDGSTDATLDLASELSDPRIRLVAQEVNQGKGAALRRGFAEARAPFVVVQDADLEYDPADYGALMVPLLAGDADVVFGSRFQSTGERRVLYFWHAVGNRLLTTLSNMSTNLNLTDMETCYKAFRREVLEAIEIEENRFGFEPEITAKLAQQNLRIYEVGISYAGRTYAEGKKIGWKDGVRALYCIARYSRAGQRLSSRRKRNARQAAGFRDADQELIETLHSLSNAHNYADWIFDSVAPHLGAHILEVGAGHGDLTNRLRHSARVTALELSPKSAGLLRDRFADMPDVDVLEADIVEADFDAEFDSVIAINVLEHVEDDVGALRQMRAAVRPGGTVIIFVPALEMLYSEFDHKIGHHRRYHRAELERALLKAGLQPVELRFMNALGSMAWWLYAVKLGRTPTKPSSTQLYDKFAIPLVRRFESHVRVPFGQSLLAVARRPLEPDGS
jgi:glycosyltransferase involved in cell wall biosynthesis